MNVEVKDIMVKSFLAKTQKFVGENNLNFLSYIAIDPERTAQDNLITLDFL